MSMNLHMATRRELLRSSGVMFAWALLPKIARAEGRDPRLLVIVLRGALDGLATVPPVGDPDWARLRGEKAIKLDGTNPALQLDALFCSIQRCPTYIVSIKAGRRRSCMR